MQFVNPPGDVIWDFGKDMLLRFLIAAAELTLLERRATSDVDSNECSPSRENDMALAFP